MIILNGTTESLEVITAFAGSVDVVSAFADINTTSTPNTFLAGTQPTNILTASTTTIVAAPAANIQRQMKLITITNRSTSTQTITVQKNVGGTRYQFGNGWTILTGEVIQFVDGFGWNSLDPFARPKQLNTTSLSGGTGQKTSALSGAVVLASDQSPVAITDNSGFLDLSQLDLSQPSDSTVSGLVGTEPVDPSNFSGPALRVQIAQQVQIDPTVPISISGQGPDNVFRPIKSDRSGNLITTISGATVSIVGASVAVGNDAVGTAPTQNPEQISGIDPSGNIRRISTDNVGRAFVQLPPTDAANQSIPELLLQMLATERAITHLLTRLVSVTEFGHSGVVTGDEADALIGEFLNPMNGFVNTTN